MPEFSLPDFSAILDDIKKKFTGGVADILSNIPKWALPAEAEEWLIANMSEGKKQQIITEKQEQLAELESREAPKAYRGGAGAVKSILTAREEEKAKLREEIKELDPTGLTAANMSDSNYKTSSNLVDPARNLAADMSDFMFRTSAGSIRDPGIHLNDTREMGPLSQQMLDMERRGGDPDVSEWGAAYQLKPVVVTADVAKVLYGSGPPDRGANSIASAPVVTSIGGDSSSATFNIQQRYPAKAFDPHTEAQYRKFSGMRGG